MKKKLTAGEVAERLGVHLSSVRKYGNAGLIERVPFGKGKSKMHFHYDAGSVNAFKTQRNGSRLPKNTVINPKPQLKLPFGRERVDAVLEAYNEPILSPEMVVFKRVSHERMTRLEQRVELIFHDLQTMMKLVRDTALKLLVDQNGRLVIDPKDIR